jgi:hypothetical protein
VAALADDADDDNDDDDDDGGVVTRALNVVCCDRWRTEHRECGRGRRWHRVAHDADTDVDVDDDDGGGDSMKLVKRVAIGVGMDAEE